MKRFLIAVLVLDCLLGVFLVVLVAGLIRGVIIGLAVTRVDWFNFGQASALLILLIVNIVVLASVLRSEGRTRTFEPMPPNCLVYGFYEMWHGEPQGGLPWTCPYCGKEGLQPTEQTEKSLAERWVRGVCSCGRIWEARIVRRFE